MRTILLVATLISMAGPAWAGEGAKSAADAARDNIRAHFQKVRKTTLVSLPARRAGDVDTIATPEPAAAPKRPLTREQVEREVRDHRNEVQYCYETLSSTQKRQAGSVTFDLVIDPDGAVRSAGVASGVKKGELEKCLERTVKRWSFPQADAPTSLSYVFVFATDK